jgi:hypothetical protein
MRILYLVLIAFAFFAAVGITLIYEKSQSYYESQIDKRKIDSFDKVAKRALNVADSLQAICDTLKQKRSVSIIEVTKWREKRLNDTFWATLEDTAKITYLMVENDSLYRIVELDCEIIEKQDRTILSQKVAINAKDSVINRTKSEVTRLSNENVTIKKVNSKVKTQRNLALFVGVLIGLVFK